MQKIVSLLAITWCPLFLSCNTRGAESPDSQTLIELEKLKPLIQVYRDTRNDRPDDVRRRSLAFKSLWDYGPRAQLAIPGIIELHVERNIPEMETLLKQIGGDEALKAFQATMIKELDADSERQRQEAIRRLETISYEPEKVTQALIQFANSDQPIFLRGCAVAALGTRKRRSNLRDDFKIDETASFEFLILTLKNEHKDLRRIACYVLEHFSDTSTKQLAPLIKTLDDPVDDVRVAAMNALGACGPRAKQANSKLVEMLKDDERRIRFFAAQTLGEIKVPTKDTTLALKRALHDSDDGVRENAKRALESYSSVDKSE